MTLNDYKTYKEIIPKWLYGQKINHIATMSANHQQFKMVNEILTPNKITNLTIDDWDLNKKNDTIFDVIFLFNVMMYSPNPKLWLENLLNSSPVIIIQDISNRKRNKNHELGLDDDQVRYSYSPHFTSNFEKSFELNSYNIKNWCSYDGGPTEFTKNNDHFIIEVHR